MGAQCGRDHCQGAAKLGDAGADDLLQDEARADPDAPAIGSRCTPASAGERGREVPQLAISPKKVPDNALRLCVSDFGAVRTSQEDLDDSADDVSKTSSTKSLDRGASALSGRGGGKLQVPGLKNSRMFSSAPGGSAQSFESETAKQRWERTGRQVGTAVRLTKLLRATPTDVPPTKCALSLDKLNDFARQAEEALGPEYRTASFRSIVQALIQPECDQSGKAFARLLNGEAPCTGHVFVCHCWDGCFREFLESLNTVFQHWPRKPNLWIAGFALVQSRRRVAFSRPKDAPFASVLKEAHAILISQSDQVELTSRIWPLWEIYLASKFGLGDKEGGLIFAGARHALAVGAVDCLRAQASISGDKEAIDSAVKEEGGHEDVNAIVRKILFRAPVR